MFFCFLCVVFFCCLIICFSLGTKSRRKHIKGLAGYPDAIRFRTNETFFFPETFQKPPCKPPRNLPETFQKLSRNLPETYPKPTRNLSETSTSLQTSPKPPRNLPETFRTPLRNLPETYPKPTRNLPETCPKPPRNLPERNLCLTPAHSFARTHAHTHAPQPKPKSISRLAPPPNLQS